MKLLYIFILLYFISETLISQQLTSSQLLDKAITYHDPNDNWNMFKGKLNITMETPSASKRDSEIHINLSEE